MLRFSGWRHRQIMKLIQVLLIAFGALALLAAGVSRIHHGSATPPPFSTLPPELRPIRAERAEIRKVAEVQPAAPGQHRDTARRHASETTAPKVTHHPKQPKSGQPVVIKVEFKEPAPQGPLLLEYQVVDPGKYIALRDAAFEKQWTSVPLPAVKASPDDKNSQITTVELPGTLQKHRRLVRYRVRAGDKMIAPDAGDAQPNFAYFVYDGVPSWSGAINPKARDAELRKPVIYSSEALERVAVYHLIGSKTAVEKATWTESDQSGGQERNAYRYTGTMVYDGVVYDHVAFRARGGSWRHAMGKNMWKFNFLPGHRFEAKDNYGNRYQTKWDKLNLGACIQQGDYGMRGEQGLFEGVGFRLFNLAGIEASHTHFVHFRIIDQPEEAPADQYAGDFWGLYLAVENVDEHFLKEHDLPPGNLYKMDFQVKTEFNGDPGVTDQHDVMQFMNALERRTNQESWWTNTVDLRRYFDYRSIIECIHHYDLDAGKNYFYYRNPQSHRWIAIPWDIDLTWGDHMYGGGHEPFFRSGILLRPPFKQQYQERLAEIRDLLFNPEQTDLLIDEYAGLISDPAGAPSLVDADRAKWDYNPVMASDKVMSMKAGQGRFYFGKPKNTFRNMVAYMKSYVSKRATWVDGRLLGDYRPPTAPRIAKPGSLDFSSASLHFQAEAGAEGVQACRWRLAEITDTNSPAFDRRKPWKYEIQPLWELEAKDNSGADVPVQLLSAGHTYRIRTRSQDASGNWSRWSSPVQFSAPGK
jgi:hypothetical protein